MKPAPQVRAYVEIALHEVYFLPHLCAVRSGAAGAHPCPKGAAGAHPNPKAQALALMGTTS